jgi:acetyltransferase
MNLEKLFNPQSIAIVGASPEEGKVGNVIAKNILQLGYAGKIYLVNPKYDRIFDQFCYRNLADITDEIDLAIIAIPAKVVVSEVQANAKKIKNYAIVSAGFSEVNEEGKKREQALSDLAKENSLHILGPNCLGFIVPKIKLNASFGSNMPNFGNISFISQSGALAVALVDLAKQRSLGFSNIISIGNKMQIAETEMLEYLEGDTGTKVVGMYLEGIKNGEDFLQIASRVSRTKPVVVLKAGKTGRSQKAIASHTGAIAGSDMIMDAAFRKSGILRADNLEDFFNLISFISQNDFPKSKKVAVITNAGGPGVLTADAFLNKKMILTELSDEIKMRLRNILPEESSVENPIDLLGDARENRYEEVLNIIEDDLEVGAIICVLTPQDQTPVEKIAQAIANFKYKSRKTIVTTFIGGERIKEGVNKLQSEGVFNFAFPEKSVKMLDDYYAWSIFRKNELENIAQTVNFQRKKTVSLIIEKAKEEKRKALYFSETQKVMDLYGIETARTLEIEVESDLPIVDAFPVVIKVDSDAVLHKTDKQGLILNIKNQMELEIAFQKMRTNFPGAKLIIQTMLEREVELILGIKKDASFGATILCGLGGIYAEVFKIAEIFIPPFSNNEIKKILQTGKLGFLFNGARGQKAYGLDDIARIILALGEFSLEAEGVFEFDINPLLVYNDGKRPVAVDIKIII